MLLTMCKGKIHRATVTEARLDYTGSITIDASLMKAAKIRPYELVHVNNMSNAVHWETYAIPGKKSQICLNGCPARLFAVGDEVIILSLAQMTEKEIDDDLKPSIVFVNKQNEIARGENEKITRF